MEKLLDITKSGAGFLTGLFKSKKFGLAVVFTSAALLALERYNGSHGDLTIKFLMKAGDIVIVYIIGQSFVEACAVVVSVFKK